MNFAAAMDRKSDTSALRNVQLNGLAVLKILKHCKESMPSLVTGQLLGLDIGQTLEVTDCFPFPVSFASLISCSQAVCITIFFSQCRLELRTMKAMRQKEQHTSWK